ARVLPGITWAHVIVSSDRYRQIAEVSIRSKRLDLTVREESTDLGGSLHAAMDHLTRQVTRHLGRLRERKRTARAASERKRGANGRGGGGERAEGGGERAGSAGGRGPPEDARPPVRRAPRGGGGRGAGRAFHARRHRGLMPERRSRGAAPARAEREGVVGVAV